MESMEERRKLVHDFTSFTGTTDEDRALSFLDAANWKLPEAVQLYYAEQAATGGPEEGGTTSGATAALEEEEVRAPLPSKFERLVDRSAQYEHLLQQKTKQKPIYEAFRNHTYQHPTHLDPLEGSLRAELAEYEHGPDAEGGTKGLARLYKAPIDLLFREGWEEAKQVATDRDIWLMVNIQSTNEFTSHQLNRDTFSNDALREMIKANFIFLQTYNDGVTGQKLVTYYKIERFPCILIVDPITGGLMRSFAGFVEADRLIEDLVEYMDCSPSAGASSQLMRRLHSSKQTACRAESIDNSNPDTTTEETIKRKTGEEPLADSEVSVGPEGETEEQHGARKRKESDPVAPEEALLATAPVPVVAGEDTCTVGVLLPSGGRVQRLFFKSDTIESLYGFCRVEFGEARSRRFKLKPRMPGSAFLEDMAATLVEAHVEDSLLALVWDA